jgi:activator of HSP90 ATPase
MRAENSATRLTLKHSRIPDGQGEVYRQGWEDYYFQPMKIFFSR